MRGMGVAQLLWLWRALEMIDGDGAADGVGEAGVVSEQDGSLHSILLEAALLLLAVLPEKGLRALAGRACFDLLCSAGGFVKKTPEDAKTLKCGQNHKANSMSGELSDVGF